MLRRRVKDALKHRFPILVDLRDRLTGRPADPEPPPAPAPEPPPAPTPESAPLPAPPASGMTFEAVQAVLDDMVRPAVQSDGGDILLIKVDGNDVYVQMVGACHGCGSAPITLRLGVERLLQEEFPQMGRLVEVGGAVA